MRRPTPLRRTSAGALLLAVASALAGCDSGGGKSTEYKPIEGNILNKLNKASQDQSQAADANKAARTRKR